MKEMEKTLKLALENLDKISSEFQLKKASFVEKAQFEALKEMVKEQIPNENSMHSIGEAG